MNMVAPSLFLQLLTPTNPLPRGICQLEFSGIYPWILQCLAVGNVRFIFLGNKTRGLATVNPLPARPVETTGSLCL
jgi:hypothetical protein